MGLVQCAYGDSSFEPTGLFASDKIDYSQLTTTTSLEAASDELYQTLVDAKGQQSWSSFFEEQGIPYLSGVSDTRGIIEFSGIEQGVYLLFELNENDYGSILPALVYMPTTIGGETFYTVNVVPKVEPEGFQPVIPNQPGTGTDLETGGKDPETTKPVIPNTNGSTNSSSGTNSSLDIGSTSQEPLSAFPVSTGNESNRNHYLYVAGGAIGFLVVLGAIHKYQKNSN